MAEEKIETHSLLVSSPITIMRTRAKQGRGFGEHDLDVIDIKFDLVFEGVNKNGDRFTEAELRNSYETLVNKLINWEHAEPNIGVITKSELVEASDTVPLHVTCEGTIMSWKYPELADQIALAASDIPGSGELGVSMECYFHDANYVIGDYEQIIPMAEDVGGELEFLRGRMLGGKLVSRELLGVFFGGAAVTATPAEKKARLLAVASLEQEFFDLQEAVRKIASRVEEYQKASAARATSSRKERVEELMASLSSERERADKAEKALMDYLEPEGIKRRRRYRSFWV